MKQLFSGLCIAGTFLTLICSCSGDENPWRDSTDGGKIFLSVTSDGDIIRSTRADDTKATIVPAPEELGITLSRTDGSYSQKWTSATAFNKEQIFPIGEYKIEASYGDINKEGFENPYYYASDVVNVTAGDEKKVNLDATLANCMVSIRYTEQFVDIYPKHSAAVKSTGHDYVVFTGDEHRPAYMTPSQMSLSLTLTNSAGKQVTIQPTGFYAKARRHYIVTIGVSGTEEQGNLYLDVQFDEEVVSETVNVSLGDELFSAPEPTISARDFNPDESLTYFERFEMDGDPRFEVYAFGGLKTVTLTLDASSTYNSPFGDEVQLVNATALDQANVEASGIEVLGLFRSPDKMGIVKMKKLLETLPVGTHKFKLQVTDAMTRMSAPVSLVAVVTAVSINIYPAADIEYGSQDVEVYVATNCPDIRNNSTFELTQERLAATIEDVQNLESAPVGNTPDNLTYYFKYKLKASRSLMRDNTTVNLFYGASSQANANTTIPMTFPKYSVQTDAYARKVVFKVIPQDSSKLKLIMDNLVVVDSQDKQQSIQSRTAADEIELLGLISSSNYSGYKFALSTIANDKSIVECEQFDTEEEKLVPNGDFSLTHQTINVPDINVGGDFNVRVLMFTDNYQITSSIDRSEADSWGSLNEFTCYSGSENNNTWFKVPSTFADGGSVTIRSVGYHHSGITPDRSGGGMNTNYYCENTPGDEGLNKSRGELFLGSYSYDGEHHRNDKIDFDSRPMGVAFDYKYTPDGDETAEVEIKVYDASGSVISQNSVELNGNSDMTRGNVYLPGYEFGKKAAKLSLCFRSTASRINTPKITIPTGNELSEGIINIRGNLKIGANTYHAFAKGSELVVDNVALIYTESTNPSNKSANRFKRK